MSPAEIARSWIGTPYVHQASTRGAGTDCLGLIRGVWRELFGTEPEMVPPYSQDWSEPQRREVLWEAAERLLRPVARGEAQASGQVLLFRMRDGSVAKHLGILADDGPYPTFIHAYSGHAVHETPFSLPWRRRVVARFDFPHVTTTQE
jgi:NlpC/P60 family putative phage cell wall peptidase